MSSAFATLMPPPRFAELNGVRMAWYEVGQNSKGRRGVPLIFLHGFPELAFSWRHQLRAAQEAGLWALAPDQRGYGMTSAPEAVEAYDNEHLIGDMLALLDHLGVDQAIWCGHDYGGNVVWQLALNHPDRVLGLVALNTPLMPRTRMEPVAMMRERMGEEMYMVHFQKPGEADAIFGNRTRAVFDRSMRRPQPGSASKGVMQASRSGKESLFPFVRQVESYDPANDPNRPFLSADEFDAYVETYARTGFTGPINWYRNMTRNWRLSADQQSRVDGVPCLMITAELDEALPPSSAAHMPHFVGDLETVMIEGVGHHGQQEAPEVFNGLMFGWLARRFGIGGGKRT